MLNVTLSPFIQCLLVAVTFLKISDIPGKLSDIPGKLSDIPGKLSDIPGKLSTERSQRSHRCQLRADGDSLNLHQLPRNRSTAPEEPFSTPYGFHASTSSSAPMTPGDSESLDHV
jgi:hypothetical protein